MKRATCSHSATLPPILRCMNAQEKIHIVMMIIIISNLIKLEMMCSQHLHFRHRA